MFYSIRFCGEILRKRQDRSSQTDIQTQTDTQTDILIYIRIYDMSITWIDFNMVTAQV